MRGSLLLRRLEYNLNNRYIFRRIPLVLALVILILVAFMARIGATFNASYEKRPILTMMVTNSILSGIADCVAQSITIVRERSMRYGQKTQRSVELHELEKKLPTPEGRSDIIPRSDQLPPPFDGERLLRFCLYGFGIGAIQFKWFATLERFIPLVKGSLLPALKRVSADQLVFAPAGVGLFYSAMSAMEGKTASETKHKLSQVYFPTLKANWMLWPAVQLLNFSIVPLQFQLPLCDELFSSCETCTTGVAVRPGITLQCHECKCPASGLPLATDSCITCRMMHRQSRSYWVLV